VNPNLHPDQPLKVGYRLTGAPLGENKPNSTILSLILVVVLFKKTIYPYSRYMAMVIPIAFLLSLYRQLLNIDTRPCK
jgi:hypothetical protein